MKPRSLTALVIVMIYCAMPFVGHAQKLTGIWKGSFVTESGEHYKLEFQVKQLGGSTVTGVSYSYLDTRFYGKASMTGNFASKEKSFNIQETRTTEVRNMGGGGTCLMNYKFTYSKSGKEEFLEGSYVGKSEDRKNPANNGVWGDCGGGKVYLRRVETSDFYVEPFLRDIPLTKTSAPAAKSVAKSNNKTLPPQNKTVAKVQVKKPVSTPAINGTVKKKTAELPKTESPIAAAPQQKAITPKALRIPAQTRARENELVKTIFVDQEDIIVRLYDNGEIDDDTISVFLDDVVVLSAQRLSTTPLTVKIKITDYEPEHVMVMVAENLGRIPPNTSLMIVQDGEKRYEVRITSTEQKNAMVRFRKQTTNR